jgi:predicted ATPase with chaperone activity
VPSSAWKATSSKWKSTIVPACDAEEAALVDGIEVLSAGHLRELVGALCGIARQPL